MAGGVEYAIVDWEAEAPRSIFFDDIYFSGDGAEEARHVFIDGNDLARRFAAAEHFQVGELGFGTGLNVLAACDLWRRIRKPGARLDFISFEKFPLTMDDLARAHRAWPQYRVLSEIFLDALPPPTAGMHRVPLADDILLTLVLGDALAALSRHEATIDAWFLDGFAPAKNPEMWSPAIFAEIARLSAPGATAATFTVAASVRKGLEGAGFAIEKRAGFGRKREMMTARIASPTLGLKRAPWFANEIVTPLRPGSSVAIIGGGVAGASLSHELKNAGIHATIFDPDGIGAGASGNPAGLIMPRLDLDEGGASRFFVNAYAHALALIARLEKAGGERIFNPCGVLLKALTDEDRARQHKLFAAQLLPRSWIEKRDDGLYFPQAGVVDPPRYCALLAGDTPLIRRRVLSLEAGVAEIDLVLDDGGRAQFDAVVIANGFGALRFAEARSLPLADVIGQIDCFPNASPPAHAIVFGPYAAPAPLGGMVIGATYVRNGAQPAASVCAAATAQNIEAVANSLPDLAAGLDPVASFPRAAIRCQTPDHIPVAGPLPDWSYYAGAYDDLRFGRRRDYPRGRFTPGVFILSGLGSRGLVTAPIAAATIVAEMTGAAVDREFAEALHPARFFIRDLRRSRRRLLLAAASGLTSP